MNNKEKIVKKILFEIIDKLTKDADVYNHNGSLWLINTDSTKWIFEFTKSKTLWYNYNFFRSALKFVSLDVNEGDNQKYITEWFESRYLNINQVKHTLEISNHRMRDDVKDTIQNGVKETHQDDWYNFPAVEDTIQNGVKRTLSNATKNVVSIIDTIQNGVKGSTSLSASRKPQVEQTIKNGVKHTQGNVHPYVAEVEDTIQNGVKETNKGIGIPSSKVDDTIENGVKNTRSDSLMELQNVENIIQNGVKHTRTSEIDPKNEVKDVIQNGVKEIQPLPAQDGNMDWGLYYQRQEDRTKPHIEYVRDVIEEHHHRRREVIVTIKDGVKDC